jgi:1,4-dihydroxy-2-naphthoate polyprenyltransferase
MAYVKLVRPHWFLASTLAAMIGILQAWAGGSYDLPLAVLVIVGVMLHHAILETWDELQDYANYREQAALELSEPATLFSGGSGVLTGQLLTVAQVWRFFGAAVAAAVVILAALVALAGWQVLLCVATGVLVMVNYNSLLKLSYRGWGELANFISFGPIMVCSAYLVMTLGSREEHAGNPLSLIDEQTVVMSLVIGAIWFGSLHIQEMLDHDEDKAGGKQTLVVKFGKEYAARVPAATGVVIMGLVLYLTMRDPGFLIVLPAAILHLCETTSFVLRWRDAAYFMRKMKSFFVYRNFVLMSLSLLLSACFRRLPDAAGGAALASIALLTAVSSLPALAFLSRNGVFRLSRRQRVTA